MKRLFILVAISLSISTCAPAAADAPVSISALSWLVGGVWTAKGDIGNIDRIEVRYTWAATQNFIQFNTRFVGTDGATKGSYAGNFYFDPSTGGIKMWYMDQDNAITQGPVEIKDDGISMTFSGPGQGAGSKQDVHCRVEVSRKHADAYHWALSTQAKDTWKPLFDLDYVHST